MSTPTSGYTATHLEVSIFVHLSHDIYLIDALIEKAKWSDFQSKLHSKSTVWDIWEQHVLAISVPHLKKKKFCNLPRFSIWCSSVKLRENLLLFALSQGLKLVHFSLITIKLTERLTICLTMPPSACIMSCQRAPVMEPYLRARENVKPVKKPLHPMLPPLQC